jgi:hypothetical protein
MEDAGNTETKQRVGETSGSESSPPTTREAIVQLKQASRTMYSLKTITENQQKWRATSTGYQNFFEFGESFLCSATALF